MCTYIFKFLVFYPFSLAHLFSWVWFTSLPITHFSTCVPCACPGFSGLPLGSHWFGTVHSLLSFHFRRLHSTYILLLPSGSPPLPWDLVSPPYAFTSSSYCTITTCCRFACCAPFSFIHTFYLLFFYLLWFTLFTSSSLGSAMPFSLHVTCAFGFTCTHTTAWFTTLGYLWIHARLLLHTGSFHLVGLHCTHVGLRSSGCHYSDFHIAWIVGFATINIYSSVFLPPIPFC